jgi:hypothetical protein
MASSILAKTGSNLHFVTFSNLPWWAAPLFSSPDAMPPRSVDIGEEW